MSVFCSFIVNKQGQCSTAAHQILEGRLEIVHERIGMRGERTFQLMNFDLRRFVSNDQSERRFVLITRREMKMFETSTEKSNVKEEEERRSTCRFSLVQQVEKDLWSNPKT